MLVFFWTSTLVVAQHFWRLPNAIRAHWGCALILFLKIGFYKISAKKCSFWSVVCVFFIPL